MNSLPFHSSTNGKEYSSERKNKKVEFRLNREEYLDEEVKVPKRGSSRGSSVTEQVIH